MSDKKLEDYLKDLDAYAQAENKQKKVEYDQSFKQQFVFPWTKVILGLSVALWVFHAPLIESAKTLTENKYIQDYVVNNKYIQRVGKLGQRFMASTVTSDGEANPAKEPPPPEPERTAAADAPNNIFAPSVTPPPVDPALEAAAAAAKVPPSDMVRIEGRWVKRTPDNIYNINGKRILYIDNRKSTRTQAAPAADTQKR